MRKKNKSVKRAAACHALENSKQAILNINAALIGRVIKTANAISSCRGKIITVGVGKSSFIAQKIAATLNSLGVLSVFLHPTDALHGDLGVISPEDALIIFSHSGNTRELINALNHASKIGPLMVAVTGDANSYLAQMCAQKLIYNIPGEGSPQELAPMASTTTCLVIGDMLAAEIAVRRGFSEKKFAQLHPSGSLSLKLIPVSRLMYTGEQVPVINARASFHQGLNEMTAKSLGVVAAVNNRGAISGIMTDGDVRRFILTGKYNSRARVSDAMRTSPKTITATATLYDALRSMEQYRVTTLFIIDKKQKPCGVVHLHQIAQHQLS